MQKTVQSLLAKAEALKARAKEVEKQEFAKIGKVAIVLYKKGILTDENIEKEIIKIFGDSIKKSRKKTENNQENGDKRKKIVPDEFMR